MSRNTTASILATTLATTALAMLSGAAALGQTITDLPGDFVSLEVNILSGHMRLLGSSDPEELVSYEIESPSGDLLVGSSFNALSEQFAGWTTIDQTQNLITELTNGAALSVGASGIPLGQVFRVGGDAQALSFRFGPEGTPFLATGSVILVPEPAMLSAVGLTGALLRRRRA